jgi:hypothetical protein
MNTLQLRESIVRETGDFSLVGASAGSPTYSTDGSNQDGVLNQLIDSAIEDLLEEMPEALPTTQKHVSMRGGDNSFALPQHQHIDGVFLETSNGDIQLRPTDYAHLTRLAQKDPRDTSASTPEYYSIAPQFDGIDSQPTQSTSWSVSAAPAVLLAKDQYIYHVQGDGTLTKYSRSGTAESTTALAVSSGSLFAGCPSPNGFYFLFRPSAGNDEIRHYFDNTVDAVGFDAPTNNMKDIAFNGRHLYILEETGGTGTVRCLEQDGTQVWSTAISYVAKSLEVFGSYVVVMSREATEGKATLHYYSAETGTASHSFGAGLATTFAPDSMAVGNETLYTVQGSRHINGYRPDGTLLNQFASTAGNDSTYGILGIATEDGSNIVVCYEDASTNFYLAVYNHDTKQEPGTRIIVHPAPETNSEYRVIGRFKHKLLDLRDLYYESTVMRDYYRYIMYRACSLWANAKEDSRGDRWFVEADKSLRANYARYNDSSYRSLENAIGNYSIREY